ncbi:MAG TPA: ABC transporter substrate-binding protein [Clostridia bacterium]|nr:ABC transporter substrate-binding protein [Clostridia bacterium]
MRKLLSIVLAIVMLSSLTVLSACGNTSPSAQVTTASQTPESSSTATASPADEKHTLNIVGSTRTYPGQEEAWNKLIEAFKAKYPNIDVTVRWQGTWDQIPENMTASKLAKEKVDIYTAGAGVINSTLASSGALLDITEIMKPYLDRFNEGMLSAYYIDGKLWGFPYGDSSESLVYYNKTMFDELGLTAPTTYAELLKVSQAIKSAKGITPMIHQGKTAAFWPMWFFETYAQTSQNKSVDNVKAFLSKKMSFANDKAVMAAFDDIKKFWDDGIMSKSSLDTDGDGVRAAFASGKAAMFYGGTWEYSALRAAVDSKIQIGAFQFPSLDGTTKPQHGGGPSDAIVIPSWVDRDNIDTIKLFIDFMTSEENVNTVISTFDPVISVYKGVQVKKTELTDALNGDIRNNTIAFLDWIWPSSVNDAFCQAIPAVIDGAMTSAKASELVQTALDNMVQEQGFTYDWYSSWTPDQWKEVTP